MWGTGGEAAPTGDGAMFARQLALALALSGIASTASYPRELAKQEMRQQPAKYVTSRIFAQKTIAEHGRIGFWRGNLADMAVRSQLGTGLALTQHLDRQLVRRGDSSPQPVAHLAAGAAAGVLTAIAYHPWFMAYHKRSEVLAELLQKRQAVNVERYTQSRILRATLRHNGLPGIYKGFGYALPATVVMFAGQFGGFKILQDASPWKQELGWAGLAASYAAALAARMAAGLLVAPLGIARQVMLYRRKHGAATGVVLPRLSGRRWMQELVRHATYRSFSVAAVVCAFDRITYVLRL